MGLMDWFKKRGGPAAAAGFSFRENDPLAAEHATISELLEEYGRTHTISEWYLADLSLLEIYGRVSSLDCERKARFTGALIQRLVHLDQRIEANHQKHGVLLAKFDDLESRLEADRKKEGPLFEAVVESQTTWGQSQLLSQVLGAVLQQSLPFTEEELNALVGWCAEDSMSSALSRPLAGAAAAVEHYAQQTTLSPATHTLALSLLATMEDPERTHKETRKCANSLRSRLQSAPPPVQPGEAWTDAMLATMRQLPESERSPWSALLAHCREASGSSPTAKWLKNGAALLEKVGRNNFKQLLLGWLPLVNEPRTCDLRPGSHVRAGTLIITDVHMDVLRGLAWLTGTKEDRERARALTALAITAFKKVPGIGPRATRVGNACITALGMMPGLDAVGQLALLKVKVKFGTAQIAIGKALNAAAEREGLPREELEEMAVPAYGLTEVGRLVETLGEFTAELAVTGSKSVAITWRSADGKVQKSLPAAVKKEFAEELKELNAAKKDLENMLPAQAERIDALYLQQKSWPLEKWLERYLQHPLIGTLARRLIWNFTTDGTTTPGLWLDGKLVDRLGHPLPLDAARTAVALWHPLDQPPDVVLGWRGFLEEWQIVQPFKQAHREVYLLTPAEERTRTYSNRFAAHILKQHQFHALCAARGWKNKLRLLVDDEYPPATRLLPQWGLRAEFWIEGAHDNLAVETNEVGAFLYLATDQVRFYHLDEAQLTAHAGGGGYHAGWRNPVATEPVPLADIPSFVFSEIMRDVDLFVGVASVGNDPRWIDAGRFETEVAAWERSSFGDLSATAQTRRELLQRLVPKLKIADRCSFAEKFLVVRGDLRTYKIHLGSGNILMSPNDRYLCIVPGAGKVEDGKVFLPFEGDRTLSVILSKAFLLAADAKITDPSITGQIGRG